MLIVYGSFVKALICLVMYCGGCVSVLRRGGLNVTQF